MIYYLSLHPGTINGKEFQENICGTAEYWQNELGMPNTDTLEISSFYFRKIEFNGVPQRIIGKWCKGSDKPYDVSVFGISMHQQLGVIDNSKPIIN